MLARTRGRLARGLWGATAARLPAPVQTRDLGDSASDERVRPHFAIALAATNKSFKVLDLHPLELNPIFVQDGGVIVSSTDPQIMGFDNIKPDVVINTDLTENTNITINTEEFRTAQEDSTGKAACVERLIETLMSQAWPEAHGIASNLSRSGWGGVPAIYFSHIQVLASLQGTGFFAEPDRALAEANAHLDRMDLLRYRDYYTNNLFVSFLNTVALLKLFCGNPGALLDLQLTAKRAVLLCPLEAIINFNAGQVYMDKGHWSKASELLNAAKEKIKDYPQDPWKELASLATRKLSLLSELSGRDMSTTATASPTHKA